jgi:Mrp family chromosome partitioning ATPase
MTPAVARPAADSPQRALKLPSIFTTADSEAEAKPAFAPDWEVDRLAWPTVCERLLETEDRYFRSVGQRLKEATQDSHHVVMITGARRGEGRTTLALCLARCAAQAGVSVAVVDADLENPQLGNQLGMETPCSWLEVVAGKSPLNEAAVSSLEDGLTLFPLTGAEDLEAEAGESQLTGVLRTIASHFPLVIIDTGPLGSDERHPFASDEDCPIDTAIVVRDLRNTTEKKAIATAELLQRSGVPAVGIAENFRGTEDS